MKPRIKHPKLSASSYPEIKKMADLVGEFIVYWGFKAVQGRMWCYLYLIKKPLNSLELAQLLDISPALVTQTVQILLDFEAVQVAQKGKNGILRFQANPNVAEVIAGVLRGREIKLLENIQAASDSLKRSENFGQKLGPIELNLERIRLMNDWIRLASFILSAGTEMLTAADNPFTKPGHFHNHAVFQAIFRK